MRDLKAVEEPRWKKISTSQFLTELYSIGVIPSKVPITSPNSSDGSKISHINQLTSNGPTPFLRLVYDKNSITHYVNDHFIR